MSLLNAAVIGIIIYWAVLQFWAASLIDKPWNARTPFWYFRVVVANIIELIVFWVLLTTTSDLPLIVWGFLAFGLVQAALVILVLPGMPKAKPKPLTMRAFVITCILYTSTAFSMMYASKILTQGA